MNMVSMLVDICDVFYIQTLGFVEAQIIKKT